MFLSEIKELSVSEIASQSAVSERQLLRKTQALLGMKPSEYLTQYRINQAKKMLKDGYTVTQTSDACGFSSQSQFSRVFKKFEKITPKQFV